MIFSISHTSGNRISRASKIKQVLSETIEREWKYPKTFCSLRIVSFFSEESFSYPPEIFFEPLEMFSFYSQLTITPQMALIGRTKANYKDHRYKILVIIPSNHSQFSLDFFLKAIGHAARDKFIFLSDDYSNIKAFFSKTNVLNTLRNKHGVYWNSGNNLHYLVEPMIYSATFEVSSRPPQLKQVFNNLNGRTIKLTHLNLGLSFKRVYNQSYDHAGIYFDLFTQYSTKLNFSMNMYNERLRPGRLGKNGTWNGLMGELQRGSSDICAALGISYERYPFVDYSTETYRAPISFSLMQPKAHLQWQALISPLTYVVWVYTVGAIIGLVTTLLLFNFAFNHVYQLDRWSASFLVPCAIVLEQSLNISFDKNSVWKLVTILCIILNFVVGTAYKSNLVGFLTFPEQPPFPKTFQQVYIQRDYKIWLLSLGGMELEVFRASKNVMMKDFWKRMKIVGIKETGECLENARKFKTVCMSWRNTIQTGLIQFGLKWPTVKRRMFMADDSDPVLYADIATVFPKQSIFQAVLNKYMGYSRDMGIVEKLVRKFWIEEKERFRDVTKVTATQEHNLEGQQNDNSKDGKPLPLKIRNFMTIGFTYIFGILVAGLGFSCEVCWNKISLLRKRSI